MKHEFLRARTFRISYEDNMFPYITINNNCSIPVNVTVTDCYSKDIVSKFKALPRDLYNELIARGYNNYG
jgi:hypothetical protein